MKVKRKRRFDRSKDAYWRGVMKEFSGSELSAREFCRRRAISEPSFYSWRRTLKERDRQSKLSGQPGANGQVGLEADAGSAPRPEHVFASVSLIDESAGEQSSQCGSWLPAMEIEIGCHTQVRIDGRCPSALLESLLSMLLATNE